MNLINQQISPVNRFLLLFGRACTTYWPAAPGFWRMHGHNPLPGNEMRTR